MEAAFIAYQIAGDDRKRERAAAMFEREGSRDYVLDGLESPRPDERGEFWAVVIDYAKWLVDQRDPNWPTIVVEWLRDGQATWEESAHACAETGFAASLSGMSHPLDAEKIRQTDVTTAEGRAMLHLHVVALRLAYRWEPMARFLGSLQTKVSELDPYSRAFHVFGFIVDGHPDADRELAQLLEAAGDNYRVHLAVLEALRLSNSRPAREQGDRMLELLDRPALRGSTSPDLLYRRAFALRRLGRYEMALVAVDDCLARLPVQQVQDRVRIIQEHDLIMAERAIAEQREAAEHAAQESLARHSAELRALVSEEVEQAQHLLSDALFRVVEVLGLFIAIVALLAGSVASAVAVNLSWWQRGALIVVAALVVLAFFHALRVVVHPRRRRGEQR